jgi:hypothetical protein
VNNPIKFSQEEIDVLSEAVELRSEAVELLKLVVAEWESDPMSVQCFDLRIVERASAVTKRLREIGAK